MKKSLLAILIISFFCLAFSVADINSLKYLILSRLQEYTSEKYPEKIYVHTDKPFYTAGEDIWFSAYLVNGVTHIASAKSSVVYVELRDYEGNIIRECKLFAESISVQGDFKLPADLKEGTYILRAYTNYMQNQPQDFFFEKEISIYSLYADETDIEKENSKSQENMELPDIGFYPEGGYLINGLKNKVAVKIKDADVDAFPILGTVEDTDGNRITDFQTFEFGLGYFYLTPKEGKEYRAVISSDEEDIFYSLPLPLSEGYVMNTSISEKELNISITTNKSEGLKNTLILGHQRGIPVFDYIEKENKNTLLFQIPKTDLIEGVLDIVLFNDSKNPVAERLVYVKKDDKIVVSFKKTNGNATTVRDRVDLKIDVKDSIRKTLPSSLSLSITDAKMVKLDKNAGNIRTYLLLNSDLRGTIKSPNYFFTDGEKIKKDAQLDLVMLTHGWRRFDWQEFLEMWSIQKFKPEDGIYINGNTVNSKSPYQNKFSETKLTLRQEGFYQESQKTDKYGHFTYGPYVFNDTINIIFQAATSLSPEHPNFTDTNIILDPPLEKPRYLPTWTSSPFRQQITKNESYRAKSRNYIFQNFKYDEDRELLEEVTVKGKAREIEEIEDKKRDKRSRSFTPSYRIVVSDMGMHGANDFMELLMHIPGIRIGRKDGESFSSQDFEINLRGRKPAYYLDDIKVPLEIARSIPQADIDFIDVRNAGQASAGYALEGQGVIAIYTKRGKSIQRREKKPGSVTFKSPGFYNARSFYAPDYSKVDRNRPARDSRSTLYWNPKVNVYSYKSTEITFYTSDEKGSFQINVEGITDNGIPFHGSTTMDVD